MKAQEVIDEARKLVGTPYRHQGCSTRGLDCWGIVLVACLKSGVLPEGFQPKANYSRGPDGNMVAMVSRYCTQLTAAEPGCLVLFRWPNAKWPSHMAIHTENGNIIHANSDHQKVVEHGFRKPYNVCVHSYWRLPGVEQ